MTTPMFDVLIIGGGVLGLSIASSFDKTKNIFLIEKEKVFGQGVSSRSSEVVHAGIYYPKGSKKAQFCVEGRRKLKTYCLQRKIQYLPLGKLLVATNDEQLSSLAKVALHAKANGVGEESGEELEFLTKEKIKQMEPELKCKAALYSPSTSVINSHELMSNLEMDALERGVNIVYSSTFLSAIHNNNMFQVKIQSDTGVDEITCSAIINCAGLHAPNVAESISNKKMIKPLLPKAYYCKGNYFKCEGISNPFRHLIYPLPESHGLGVHLTIDTNGNARFGPDVEWIDSIDSPACYIVNPKRAESFYSAIRSYWPSLPDNCLVPDYAGIRPKLGPASSPAVDFQILDQSYHGIPGLVHCLGVESPGLTSSLALGPYIAKLI